MRPPLPFAETSLCSVFIPGIMGGLRNHGGLQRLQTFHDSLGFLPISVAMVKYREEIF